MSIDDTRAKPQPHVCRMSKTRVLFLNQYTTNIKIVLADRIRIFIKIKKFWLESESRNNIHPKFKHKKSPAKFTGLCCFILIFSYQIFTLSSGFL